MDRGVKYTNTNLVEIVSELAETDLSSFFDRFVFGDATPPLREYLEKAGLRPTVSVFEVYLEPDERAVGLRREIRSSIAGI